MVFNLLNIGTHISTHAPLAGRDQPGRQLFGHVLTISTHAPLAGRDPVGRLDALEVLISTHAPLAGRDPCRHCYTQPHCNFNPRAPCGARRLEPWASSASRSDFNPRAPCGARPRLCLLVQQRSRFQPTRPLRGATGAHPGNVHHRQNFNPRAPCGARHIWPGFRFWLSNFNPRAPCGARPGCGPCRAGSRNFNPRAPCGARPQAFGGNQADYRISTHAPLAGRDGRGRKETGGRAEFQPTRPLRGATASLTPTTAPPIFQPTRPLRGATSLRRPLSRKS